MPNRKERLADAKHKEGKSLQSTGGAGLSLSRRGFANGDFLEPFSRLSYKYICLLSEHSCYGEISRQPSYCAEQLMMKSTMRKVVFERKNQRDMWRYDSPPHSDLPTCVLLLSRNI